MTRETRRRAGLAATLVAALLGAILTTAIAVRARGGSAPLSVATATPSPAAEATALAEIATAAATPVPALPPTPAPTPAPTPVPTPVPTPPPDSLPGHVVTSSIGGHTVLVYVPGAYAVEPASTFPVVYFLHGSPGNAQGWIDGGRMPAMLDGLISGGRLRPILAVFPDDQGVVADDSYWGNTPLGDTVETWFVSTLIPTIDTTYRTLGAGGRGIAGLSAGGFGSVNLALRHPGLFSWVGSYSGVFTGPTRLFGADSAANSPAITIDNLPTNERFALYVGGGAQDTDFGSDTAAMISTLAGLDWSASGAPLDAEWVPGPHSWEAWSAEAKDSLIWLGSMWGRS
jgi:enterochelin esterase-like enzyme